MLYHSTRSSLDKTGSKDAILKGLCPDGGLYVSDDIFKSGLDMQSLMDLEYEEIVFEVFRALLTDYSDEELKDCIPSARNEADAGETAEAIDAFLRKQTAVKRKIFIRRYWFADSIADIAKRNGMSESKVTSILFRLRRELKKYLESEGIEI